MKNVKLVKIDIKNYRSCVSTTFEPTQELSALIGPNGSGKTTILSAIQLLIKLYASTNYYRHRSPDPYSSDCVINATFQWFGKKVFYKARISLINNERNEDEILDATESWTMPAVIGSRKQLAIPLGALSQDYRYPGRSFRESLVSHIGELSGDQEAAEAATRAIVDISKFIASISYYSASVFTNPSSSPISFEVDGESMVRRGLISVGHKKFLYDLYTAYRNETIDFKNYCEIVGSEGLNLVDHFTFQSIETSSSVFKVLVGGRITNREKKTSLIVPNFFIYGNALSPSQLSEGTFKTLALIFYIMTNHGSMLLIEEPEVCVHHGLLSSIVELIKSYSHEKQIIISTHSDQLIDHIPLESVFKTTRSEETTSVTSVTKEMGSEELKALRDYLQNEGGLGQYWKHGEL